MYVGFGPMGWQAAPKHAAITGIKAGQVWAKNDFVEYTYVIEGSSQAGDSKVQVLWLSGNKVWGIQPVYYLNRNNLLNNFSKLIDDGISHEDWNNIIKYTTIKQPKLLSGMEETWNYLVENSLYFDINKLPVLSPRELDLKKDEVLDRYNRGEINREQLDRTLRQLKFAKKAALSISSDGGFFDSPGPGLGQADRGDAMFPSNETLPKGKTNESVNEDVQIGYPGLMDNNEETSIEKQIREKYGTEYEQAFIMLKDLKDNSQNMGQKIQVIVDNSDFALDIKILKQLVDKYILGK